MKMTKAFIENISDDFICGLSLDMISDYKINDTDDLLKNEDALIKYTNTMIDFYKAIQECETDYPLMYYPRIRCYKSFLNKNKIQGGK